MKRALLMITVGLLAIAEKISAAEWPPATTLVAPGVKYLADVAYLEPGRKEKLDLYLPPAVVGGGPRPAIVYFHGGGWVKGDKATERERNFGNRLASAGYVFVSVNYALGQRVWPGNLHDCKNAVRFIRANAERYGVDPERIVAMGASAGGHLALMVGYTGDQPELEPVAPYAGISNRVSAVVNLYGITDLLTRRVVQGDGTPTDEFMDSHSPTMLGVTRAENRELWRQASPTTYVSAACPPTLIMHGRADATVNYTQAVELANALRAKAVPHELVLLEGTGHMFHLDAGWEHPIPAHVRTTLLLFLSQHTAPAQIRAGS